jgi:hypothetical protein
MAAAGGLAVVAVEKIAEQQTREGREQPTKGIPAEMDYLLF